MQKRLAFCYNRLYPWPEADTVVRATKLGKLWIMANYIAIYDALHSFLGEEEGNRWATKPNKLSMFSGRRPVDAIIQEGRPMMKRTQRLTRGILAGM